MVPTEPNSKFHPGMDKPPFLRTTHDVFRAKCAALYRGMGRAEIQYVLTPRQFAAVDLILYKGLSQSQAAKKHRLSTPHGVMVRLQSAAKRVEKWRRWKAQQQ